MTCTDERKQLSGGVPVHPVVCDVIYGDSDTSVETFWRNLELTPVCECELHLILYMLPIIIYRFT